MTIMIPKFVAIHKKPTDEELTADTDSGDCERLHKDYKTKDKT